MPDSLPHAKDAKARPSIERACYWLARREHTPLPPVRGRQHANVAIVGAGFTGLWTAHYLKDLDPNLDVAIVEQGRVAYGASGRNAGMISDTIDHSHELAVDHFGRVEARRLAALGRENLGEMLDTLVTRNIACDLERTGTLNVALSEAHVEGFRADVTLAKELGIEDLVLLDAEDTRRRIRSERYRGALFNPHGATVDPVQLATGLANDVRARGVTIYEGSRVTGIEAGGARARVRTERGEIVAEKVILATSAYSHQLLPELSAYFLPLYDYVLVSEPLDAAQRSAIAWRGREGVNDGRNFFNYYRLTADERVLWGTSEACYHENGSVGPRWDHSERHYDDLRRSFAVHFPALAALEFPYAWGGPIDATTRFTPFFGSVHGGRVLYGLGFTGHGIATTHLAGKILAHMGLARPSELLALDLVRRKPLPYPPEPLRSWAVNAVTRDLRRVDEGRAPSLLLRCLDALGIGLSS